MSNVPFDCRYSKILEKNPREIVLLRGNGCKWRRCRFCDYHTDFSLDEQANFQLNSKVLAQVTGEFGRLEVINSGSFCDLGDATPEEIARYFQQVCLLQGLPGQSKESMLRDIELGLKYFDRVCVNIMVENTKPIKPDYGVIEIFKREVYPLYKDNEQVVGHGAGIVYAFKCQTSAHTSVPYDCHHIALFLMQMGCHCHTQCGRNAV